jgi:hypothetical protein
VISPIGCAQCIPETRDNEVGAEKEGKRDSVACCVVPICDALVPIAALAVAHLAQPLITKALQVARDQGLESGNLNLIPTCLSTTYSYPKEDPYWRSQPYWGLRHDSGGGRGSSVQALCRTYRPNAILNISRS